MCVQVLIFLISLFLISYFNAKHGGVMSWLEIIGSIHWQQILSPNYVTSARWHCIKDILASFFLQWEELEVCHPSFIYIFFFYIDTKRGTLILPKGVSEQMIGAQQRNELKYKISWSHLKTFRMKKIGGRLSSRLWFCVHSKVQRRLVHL